MCPRPRFRDFTPIPPVFRPTLTQALVCDLFIERNDEFWGSENHPSHFWGYLRSNKTWHRCGECANYMTANWAADRHGQPFEDFLPAIHRDIHRVIRPLLETATPAEQRRAGSFVFINGVVKMLEHDPRVIILPWELNAEPRPIREELAAERAAEHRVAMQERRAQ